MKNGYKNYEIKTYTHYVLLYYAHLYFIPDTFCRPAPPRKIP